MKRPGEEMVGDPLELSLVEGPEQGKGGEMDAYDRLLGHAMEGDATLFARQDAVGAAWAIVDPLIRDLHPPVRIRARKLGTTGSRSARGRSWGWNTPE